MRQRILWGTLAVATVTLVAGALGATAIRREARDAAQEELFRQAEVTASLVERELGRLAGSSVDRPVVARVQRVLEEVRVIGGHDFLEAALVTPRGRRIELVDDPVLLPLIGAGEVDRNISSVAIDDQRVFATVRSISVPVESGQGAFRLVVAIGRFDTFVIGAVITRTLLFALVVGGAVAAVLSLLLSRDLGRRLDRLSRAARRYAAGDFSARAPADGRDELAAVGRSFNDMAADMSEMRRREREFLMSVGHDLRTPLTTIRGYAEGLDAGTFGDEDLPRVAGVLHAQTDRLSRLVEDLMLLARLEMREFDLRPESVELAAHLTEVVDGYRDAAGRAGVRLEARIADVGSIDVDPDRIAQVAANLLENAFRYTPEAGRITFVLEAAHDRIRFEVTDTGPGIDEADLPFVFERLYVAQRYRPVRPKGSGLGLAIVKQLVDAMGGTVGIESAPGKGTTVSVTLPGT